MHKIVAHEQLGPQVYRMEVEAALIAGKRKAGQFIILRIDERGERIPLTIAGADPDAGTLTLIYQVVGKTTHYLSTLKVGQHISDIVGPLGRPTHIENFGTAVCVGGGIGIAPLYPITKALKEAGNRVISIIGARSQDLLLLEDEMRAVSDELIVTTDDGSYGRKALVTEPLRELLEGGEQVGICFAIGPAIMMKFVCKTTEPFGVNTVVSLNSIMIDGTGMCGGCRVAVEGESKFVCVDGPEFDGHKVDFDLLLKRLETYKEHEQESYRRWREHREQDHECKLDREIEKVKSNE